MFLVVPECLSSFAWNGENLFNCTGSYGMVSKEVQTEEVKKFLSKYLYLIVLHDTTGLQS